MNTNGIMDRRHWLSFLWLCFALLGTGMALRVEATVVLNELMYHPPGEAEEIQWIELHNTGPQDVTLDGWSLDAGVKFTFPAGAKLAKDGYLVLCRDAGAFQRVYPGVTPFDSFQGKLKTSGEQIDLKNARGEPVDSVAYQDSSPWPIAPDGFSASLERVTPSEPANLPHNWVASPLTARGQRPGGTPGKRNAGYSPALAPGVLSLTAEPSAPKPTEIISVTVRLVGNPNVRSVTLLARDARSGYNGTEERLPMERAGTNVFKAKVPARKLPGVLRLRAAVEGENGGKRFFPGPNEPRPAVSLYVHEPAQPARIPQAFILQFGQNPLSGERNYNRSWNSPSKPSPPIQGSTAFLWIGTNGEPAKLFDFVTVHERTAGWKVHLHRDNTLDGMTTLNFTFEDHERFVVAEPLAYDLHRRAGVPASRTEFVRLSFDNRNLGYHLMVEQPNKAFLRHQGRNDNGHLYKLQWFGNSVVEQHEKKTRRREGHADLLSTISDLQKTKGTAQWEVIKRQFNVEEILTYFAVTSLAAYWDGYFNNHFIYHDIQSGKWEIYPWDLDKACGFHDGVGMGIFYELPLTFGAEGDKPPGWTGRPPRNFHESGSPWWRPGGPFSKPILANPMAKKLYHSRIRELLDREFTQETMNAAIDRMRIQLQDEVRIRAQATGDDPRRAQRRLDAHLQSLKEFVRLRREYLLAQKEIAEAGPFDRNLLR